MDARHGGDIDLLVGPEDVERADRVLQKNGYPCIYAFHASTPLQKKRLAIARLLHFNYEVPKKRIKIELHWRLLPRYFLTLPFDRLLFHGSTLVIGGTSLRTLSDENQLIYLCAHGAFHGWTRLKWLCDLGQIQSGHAPTAPLDWGKVIDRTERMGISRPVLQGLVLSHLLLGSPLPEPVSAGMARDTGISRLVKAGFARIIDPEPLRESIPQRFSMEFYRIRLRKDLGHKINRMHALLLCTTDWQDLPLPDLVFPLYYIVRPFFWVRRRIFRRLFARNPIA